MTASYEAFVAALRAQFRRKWALRDNPHRREELRVILDWLKGRYESDVS